MVDVCPRIFAEVAGGGDVRAFAVERLVGGESIMMEQLEKGLNLLCGT